MPTNALPKDSYLHIMKFVVSSTVLLSHLQAISRTINSKNYLPVLDEWLLSLRPSNPDHEYLSKNKINYDELNILLKLRGYNNKDLSISKYETENTPAYKQFILSSAELIDETERKPQSKPYKNLNNKYLYSGSTKQLLHNLAIFTGHEMSTLFRVLRNTLIHSLSIFFGLCCSCSGYIFDAITGTSTHPVPSSL